MKNSRASSDKNENLKTFSSGLCVYECLLWFKLRERLVGERKVSEKENQEIDSSEFMLKLMQTSSQSQVNRVEYLFCAHRGPKRVAESQRPSSSSNKRKRKNRGKLHDEKRKKTYNDIVLVCAKGEEWKKGRKEKRKFSSSTFFLLEDIKWPSHNMLLLFCRSMCAAHWWWLIFAMIAEKTF